jgi:hypothetical protein
MFSRLIAESGSFSDSNDFFFSLGYYLCCVRKATFLFRFGQSTAAAAAAAAAAAEMKRN